MELLLFTIFFLLAIAFVIPFVRGPHKHSPLWLMLMAWMAAIGIPRLHFSRIETVGKGISTVHFHEVVTESDESWVGQWRPTWIGLWRSEDNELEAAMVAYQAGMIDSFHLSVTRRWWAPEWR